MAQRRPHGSSLQQNIADPGLSWRKQVLEEDHKSKAGEEAEEIRRQIEKKRIEEARERLRSNAEKYDVERKLREESGNAAESRVRRVDPDQERPTESERPKNTRAENQEAAQKKMYYVEFPFESNVMEASDVTSAVSDLTSAVEGDEESSKAADADEAKKQAEDFLASVKDGGITGDEFSDFAADSGYEARELTFDGDDESPSVDVITAADACYFFALGQEGALLSVISMVRRCSVVVTFVIGAVLFKERNLRGKAVSLLLMLAGIFLLFSGTV